MTWKAKRTLGHKLAPPVKRENRKNTSINRNRLDIGDGHNGIDSERIEQSVHGIHGRLDQLVPVEGERYVLDQLERVGGERRVLDDLVPVEAVAAVSSTSWSGSAVSAASSTTWCPSRRWPPCPRPAGAGRR
jgi:hypothetical protein